MITLSHVKVCSCRADAPKVPSVLMSHPGDIFKDSSVTLTCSSDAYPPHTYAWNKENQKLGSEPHLVLSSIQSSDSGEYYCTAENELGKTSSKYVLINVKCESNSIFHSNKQLKRFCRSCLLPSYPQSAAVICCKISVAAMLLKSLKPI